MRKETFASIAMAASVLLAAVSFVVVADPATGAEEESYEEIIPDQVGGVEVPGDVQESAAVADAEPGDSNGDAEVIVLRTEMDEMDSESITEAGENLISIDFADLPINDMIKMFSSISGANIITAGDFTNTVNASLREVEWRSAFELILGSVSLAVVEDPSSRILMVVTSEQYQEKMRQMEATKPLVTAIYNPKYLDAVDVVRQILEMNLLSPRGSIITSQSAEQTRVNLKSSSLSSESIQNPSITTSIIIRDIEEYVQKTVDMIRELDKREPQVLIEARIVDIIDSSGKKTGFDWEMLDHFGVSAGLRDLKWTMSDEHSVENLKDNQHELYDNRTKRDQLDRRFDIDDRMYEETTTTYEELPPGSGNWVAQTVITPTRTFTDSIEQGDLRSSTLSDTVADSYMESKVASAVMSVSDVSLFVSALQKMDDTDMISHPLIIVGNKVESKIHVGERYPTVTSTRTDNTDATTVSAYSETVEWNDLGLTLWVVPEIDLENDMVRLTVNPKMSTWVKDIKTDSGSVLPVISTRHLSSRVQVPSGYTVAIGGLIDSQKRMIEKKVPLLGDIPILGRLFRHNNEQIQKHNLIILLTVTILDDTAPAIGLEETAEKSLMKLDDIKLAPAKAESVRQIIYPWKTTTNDLPDTVTSPKQEETGEQTEEEQKTGDMPQTPEAVQPTEDEELDKVEGM